MYREYLLVTAQISGALLGFVGVALTFGRRAEGLLSRRDESGLFRWFRTLRICPVSDIDDWRLGKLLRSTGPYSAGWMSSADGGDTMRRRLRSETNRWQEDRKS